MIDWILLLILLITAFIVYLIMAQISHYYSRLLGSIIPNKLCIFCLINKSNKKTNGDKE